MIYNSSCLICTFPYSEAQIQLLNAPVSSSELSKIIQILPNGKFLGPDSFSNEYYKIFNKILPPHLIDIFTRARHLKSFLPEMLRAYVVTISKSGKEPINHANFRPISIINLDVKIFTKLLAKCLLTVLPTLIKKGSYGVRHW